MNKQYSGFRVVLIAMHFSEYSLRLAEGLAEKNDVLLVVNEKNYFAEVDELSRSKIRQRMEIAVLPHRRTIRVLAGNIFKLAKLVRGFRPDVIHVQEEPKDYLVGALPFFLSFPFVLTVHDPSPHLGKDAQRLKWSRRAWYVRFLRMRASQFIVHGDALKAKLQAASNIPQAAITVVPHGPLGPDNVPLDFEWEPGNCLFFGRIEEYKGLGVMLDALEIIRREGVQVVATIAGRGSDLERYRSRIGSMPGVKLIEKYLSPAEVVEEFKKANLVVLPYIEGTQSGVAAYAIGLNRPIVASNVGSIPDMVVDGVTGLIVTPNDPRQLAKAIEAVIVDQVIARRYAANVKELRDGALSWASIAEKTVGAYRLAIGRVA